MFSLHECKKKIVSVSGRYKLNTTKYAIKTSKMPFKALQNTTTKKLIHIAHTPPPLIIHISIFQNNMNKIK